MLNPEQTGQPSQLSGAFLMKQIPLTQGQFALVDDDDFERVNQFKWHAIRIVKKCGITYYAVRSTAFGQGKKRKTIIMHRFIMGFPIGKVEIDHADNNGLNNQKHNLRIATRSENQHNRSAQVNCISRYKGVTFRRNKYQSRIMVNYKSITVGYYKDEIQAAKAYDKKAIELFGEFAKTNF